MYLHKGAGSKMASACAKSGWHDFGVHSRLRMCSPHLLGTLGVDHLSEGQSVGGRHEAVLPKPARVHSRSQRICPVLCLETPSQSFQRSPVLWQYPRSSGTCFLNIFILFFISMYF